jgi:hypothetical protein
MFWWILCVFASHFPKRPNEKFLVCIFKVAKDPNTVTTINKFLARDLGSYLAPEIQKSLDHNEPWILAQIGEHLASRIPDAIDKKEAWMKVKINAEIDQHLSTVTCKILDDPNVDVMIREKISESIDDVILDRYYCKRGM